MTTVEAVPEVSLDMFREYAGNATAEIDNGDIKATTNQMLDIRIRHYFRYRVDLQKGFRMIGHFRKFVTLSMLIAAMIANLDDFSQAVEIRIGKTSANRVLFLGNSLTFSAANADIGWSGNWGMASSSEDRDYAHLVVSDIASLNGGVTPAMKAVNVYHYGQYEQNYASFDVATEMASLLDWNPDILVVELGENVESLTTQEKRTSFANSFLNLLATFKENSNPTIFVRNTWWPDTTKDTVMQEATVSVGGVWVDLGNLRADPLNIAKSMSIYTHAGVADHPSDQGMQAIADGMFSAMKTHCIPEPCPLAMVAIGVLYAFAAGVKNKIQAIASRKKLGVYPPE